MWILSSLTRDWTHAPWGESVAGVLTIGPRGKSLQLTFEQCRFELQRIDLYFWVFSSSQHCRTMQSGVWLNPWNHRCRGPVDTEGQVHCMQIFDCAKCWHPYLHVQGSAVLKPRPLFCFVHLKDPLYVAHIFLPPFIYSKTFPKHLVCVRHWRYGEKIEVLSQGVCKGSSLVAVC